MLGVLVNAIQNARVLGACKNAWTTERVQSLVCTTVSSDSALQVIEIQVAGYNQTAWPQDKKKKRLCLLA